MSMYRRWRILHTYFCHGAAIQFHFMCVLCVFWVYVMYFALFPSCFLVLLTAWFFSLYNCLASVWLAQPRPQCSCPASFPSKPALQLSVLSSSFFVPTFQLFTLNFVSPHQSTCLCTSVASSSSSCPAMFPWSRRVSWLNFIHVYACPQPRAFGFPSSARR